MNEDQIRESKQTDQFARDILRALEPQPKNATQHIDSVMLVPRNDTTRFDQGDGGRLRKEVVDFIEQNDQPWPWGPDRRCKEFDCFPTLARYLTEVWFDSRVTGQVKGTPSPREIPWIDVLGRGGSCSGQPAREALQNIILKKVGHYGISSGQRVDLLIHYGVNALAYNPPFMDSTTPDFAAAAQFASEVVQSCSKLPFERVYLCNTLAPTELEAYEIFPSLIKCG